MKTNFWFGTAVLGCVAAVMTPMILLAAGAGGGGGFDAVVKGIESHYNVHATKIPFMGLVSGVAGIVTHGGVRGLHVAEIEHLEGPVDGAELNALVEERVGKGWQRMIRETTHHKNAESEAARDDQTLIYVRPDGPRMAMLIVDLDAHEMNIVQVSVNPDQLSQQIGEHHHGRDRDDSNDTGDKDHRDKDHGDKNDQDKDGDSE